MGFMNGDVKTAKKAIRSAMIARRKAMDADWIVSASAAIVRRVAALDVYLASQAVCLFAALPGEVRLDGLRADSMAAGRRVLLPAWRADERAYGFKDWTAETALRSGHWGVPEPDSDTFAELGGSVCMMVPGLAFGADGGRIGYGGGHYDRLLGLPVRSGVVVAVGVGFDFQVQEGLPQEEWDRHVDIVVTERRTLVCRLATVQ